MLVMKTRRMIREVVFWAVGWTLGKHPAVDEVMAHDGGILPIFYASVHAGSQHAVIARKVAKSAIDKKLTTKKK